MPIVPEIRARCIYQVGRVRIRVYDRRGTAGQHTHRESVRRASPDKISTGLSLSPHFRRGSSQSGFTHGGRAAAVINRTLLTLPSF